MPDGMPPFRPVRFVKIKHFCTLTGYTENAIYRKMSDGIWVEGRQYRRAPDGVILVDLAEYERWVEGDTALASRR